MDWSDDVATRTGYRRRLISGGSYQANQEIKTINEGHESFYVGDSFSYRGGHTSGSFCHSRTPVSIKDRDRILERASQSHLANTFHVVHVRSKFAPGEARSYAQ